MRCSALDSAGMCKHLAATMYGVGNRLDLSPELLFLLRAVDHKELIEQAIPQPRSGPGAAHPPIAMGELGAIFDIVNWRRSGCESGLQKPRKAGSEKSREEGPQPAKGVGHEQKKGVFSSQEEIYFPAPRMRHFRSRGGVCGKTQFVTALGIVCQPEPFSACGCLAQQPRKLSSRVLWTSACVLSRVSHYILHELRVVCRSITVKLE